MTITAVQSTTKPESIFLNRTDERIPKLGNLIILGHRELIYTFLGKGYVDAVAAHEESIVQYRKDYDASFRILEEPLMITGIGVAFAKEDDRGICEQMGQTQEEMRLDGTSLKIIENFFHAEKAEAEKRMVEIVNYVKVQCSTTPIIMNLRNPKVSSVPLKVPDK